MTTVELASLPDAASGEDSERRVLHPLLRPGALVAIAYVVLVLIAAVAPTLLTSADPFATAPADRLLPPSWSHLFGTDELGRDLFARVVHGTGLSLQAATIAVAIGASAGLALGALSGFAGGLVDIGLMRLVDVTLALPGLLTALAVVTAIGFGTTSVAIAVGIGLIPGFARITRSEVLRISRLPYIEAARVNGVPRPLVILRHIVPNAAGPVLALGVLEVGAAVLIAASLSFLGFGAAPPAPEWGNLIASGRDYVVAAPWLTLLPGLVLGLFVFSLGHLSYAGRRS